MTSPNKLTVYFNPFDGASIEENNERLAKGWVPLLTADPRLNRHFIVERRLKELLESS
jgi:hypothetical protein